MRTWLYRIATNRCLTELAKSDRRTVLPSGLGDPEPDPDVQLKGCWASGRVVGTGTGQVGDLRLR